MTPMELYQQDLQREDFKADAAQKNAVEHLQRLYDELVAFQPANKGLLASLLFKKKPQPILGIYFWGGVGRGKTYLVDTFFNSLPFEQKMRVHYHRFMQRVHADLKKMAGQANPLRLVAKQLAQEVRVLCLDEFFVKDITDAMLLANLLDALFSEGVVLVTTSNIVPDQLYADGLQRAAFLPAIELIKQHTEVVNVDSGVDYRLRTLTQAAIYYCPLGAEAEANLKQSFTALAASAVQEQGVVLINDREIQFQRQAGDVIWFEFSELCDGPRSQFDYIEIAKQFATVFLSNVPQLGAAQDDQTRRFINLIDEFYDRSVKLIISAAVPIDALYTGTSLAFEMQRTQSRLLEMQSHEYLALEHQP